MPATESEIWVSVRLSKKLKEIRSKSTHLVEFQREKVISCLTNSHQVSQSTISVSGRGVKTAVELLLLVEVVYNRVTVSITD